MLHGMSGNTLQLPKQPFWIASYRHGTARAAVGAASADKRKHMPNAPGLARLLLDAELFLDKGGSLGKAWETERAPDGPYIVGFACTVSGRKKR